MDSIIQATRNTSSRGGFYGHVMLFGPPGTGKTLFAEKLARESKMDFALMTGPSFDQFKSNEAIVEIKTLFSWAKKSKRGLLLFIDEADSFLEHRSTLNPERIRVLNEWISQTGTETRQFMCVYATNRAEVLDPAIQSRITRSFEFPAPSEEELLGMLQQYIQMYLIDEIGLKETKQWWKRAVTKRIDISSVDYAIMRSLAAEFAKHRFVGRDVTNFVISVAQEAYADPNFAVTPLMLAEVMRDQIKKKQTELQYSEKFAARLKL
jgi:ATPase family AAA domain-containing protein 3A/B